MGVASRIRSNSIIDVLKRFTTTYYTDPYQFSSSPLLSSPFFTALFSSHPLSFPHTHTHTHTPLGRFTDRRPAPAIRGPVPRSGREQCCSSGGLAARGIHTGEHEQVMLWPWCHLISYFMSWDVLDVARCEICVIQCYVMLCMLCYASQKQRLLSCCIFCDVMI